MTRNRDKQDMQGVMESLEKKIDSMKEVYEKANKETLDKTMEMMKTLIQTELGSLKNDIGEIKKEIQSTTKKIDSVEKKTKDLEEKLEKSQEVKVMKGQLAVMECKLSENHLRLRGIPEQDKENTFDYVVEILAKYLNEEPEDLTYKIDLCYRVNSEYAQKKKIPRDIVIQLISKRLRENIMKQHYRTPLEIDGKAIKIMKELPKQVLYERQKYKKFTQALKDKNIKYRWEIPEGLSFNYQGAKIIIKSAEQLTNFVFKNCTEFGNLK